MWEDSGFAKPSFFWLDTNLNHNIPLAQSIRARGYTIGSHSFDHPDFGNLAKATKAADINGANRGLFASDLNAPNFSFAGWQAATMQREIVTATQHIYKTLDLDSTVADGEHLFRLPYGSGVKNPLIGTYFAKLNIRHYFWTIDSLDWQDKNPLSILERIQKQMQLSKRGIILIHDIHPQSVQASQLLIDAAKKGTMPVPVEFVALPRKW
jgi:peptidoglycan/xylan/chitin deacetylase (PgdA/CDA1 family)